jgi:hypothetical protein
MDKIQNFFKYLDWKLAITFAAVLYWCVDLFSKKFEKDAIIFKLYRYIHNTVYFRKQLMVVIGELVVKVDRIQTEVTYNGGSITLAQVVKGVDKRQMEMFEKINGIENKQAIKNNEDKGRREISDFPEFESTSDGRLIEVNKDWLDWLGVDNKNTILGTGYVKILTKKQKDLLEELDLIGTVQENDFDDIIEYQHYKTHKAMKGLVRATIIKDMNGVVVKVIGRIIPIDWEIGYKKSKQAT